MNPKHAVYSTIIWSITAFCGCAIEGHPGYGLVAISFLFLLMYATYAIVLAIPGGRVTIQQGPANEPLNLTDMRSIIQQEIRDAQRKNKTR